MTGTENGFDSAGEEALALEERREQEKAEAAEADAMDVAMHAMEVERENWWDSMTIGSESGHTDQLTEEVTPKHIKGYLMFDKVITDILCQVISERHRQQNMGYTKASDLEHVPGYLPETATFLLDGLRYNRVSGELRERALREAIAVLVAEWERVAGWEKHLDG